MTRKTVGERIITPLFFYFYSVAFLYKGGSAAAATPGPVLELPPPVAGLTVEPLRDQRGLVLPARAFIAFSCTVTGPFLFSRLAVTVCPRRANNVVFAISCSAQPLRRGGTSTMLCRPKLASSSSVPLSIYLASLSFYLAPLSFSHCCFYT